MATSVDNAFPNGDFTQKGLSKYEYIFIQAMSAMITSGRGDCDNVISDAHWYAQKACETLGVKTH